MRPEQPKPLPISDAPLYVPLREYRAMHAAGTLMLGDDGAYTVIDGVLYLVRLVPGIQRRDPHRVDGTTESEE